MSCSNNLQYHFIMSEQSQHKNILITIVLMTLVIVAVAVIGTLSLKSEPETI